jgi:hypothetical protein
MSEAELLEGIRAYLRQLIRELLEEMGVIGGKPPEEDE